MNHKTLFFKLLILSVFLLISPKSEAQQSGIADKKTYLADIMTELGKKWPTNRTINLVFHGHSVPTGYFAGSNVRTFHSYPHIVRWNLKNRYLNSSINSIRTSIGGETAHRGAERFADEVLVHRPDLITIDYSLNDRGVGLEKSKIAWEKMIRLAKEKGVKVILLTPTADLNARMDDPQDPLAQHAEQVRELAKKHNVGLVDSFAAFKKYVDDGGELKDLMSQSNHPNRKGHDIVSALLLEWFPAK